MAPGHDHEAGKGLIFGKYELLERLGRGGMAEVFKALSVGVAGFSRPVVIKRILPHLSSNKQFVDMFVKEASIAASLDHPNIVQVFDLGRHEGDLFMVLEYVPGTDLGTVIAHHATVGKRVPHEIVAYLFVDVCKALECAHGQRAPSGELTPVIHRDVSPQNVLLSGNGHVKLADFGLATPIGAARVTMPGIIKGKLGYMSPEQARGARTLDIRSDLFSVGVVMYEAFSGRRLFVGSSPADTIRRVREVIVPSLSKVAPGLPEVLVDLVHSLLAREPADRPQSSKEVRRVLAGYLRAVSPPVDATTLSAAVRRVMAEQPAEADDEEVSDDLKTHAADLSDLSSEDGRATIFEPTPTSSTDEDGRATLFEATPSEAAILDDVDLRETEPPATTSDEADGDERDTEPIDDPDDGPPTRPMDVGAQVGSPGGDDSSPVLIARVVTVGGSDDGSDADK